MVSPWVVDVARRVDKKAGVIKKEGGLFSSASSSGPLHVLSASSSFLILAVFGRTCPFGEPLLFPTVAGVPSPSSFFHLSDRRAR